jgi:hypothetical protein
MQHKLLNRFEILFPEKSEFADFRRAYIDHDLSSIFRLIKGKSETEIDDIRSALLSGDINRIFKIAKTMQDSRILDALHNILITETEFDFDSISQGQLKSKMWLIETLKELKLNLGTVYLCAGWYGILAALLYDHDLTSSPIISIDMDETVIQNANIFNAREIDIWRGKFHASCADITSPEFSYNQLIWIDTSPKHVRAMRYQANTVINTSCEHIVNFDYWYQNIPDGMLVILQSNNFEDIEEHSNCHASLKEFADVTPMKSVIFEGQLDLEKYSRFMRIGIK